MASGPNQPEKRNLQLQLQRHHTDGKSPQQPHSTTLENLSSDPTFPRKSPLLATPDFNLQIQRTQCNKSPTKSKPGQDKLMMTAMKATQNQQRHR
jgi:hypothetical protein